jgi:hypothetical protein
VEHYNDGYSLIDQSLVLPEERFEQLLSLPASVYVAPWRSLWKEGLLGEVKIPESCTSTILKWEWEIEPISRAILNSNIRYVFCTSTGKRCPLKTFLFPDYVASDIVDLAPKSGVFFMGWNNNKLRNSIFSNYSGVFSVTLRDSYSSDERNKAHRNQFTEGLAKAEFSLCPKGVGSGTSRFWESLSAGAIPILVSDEFDLPPIWDWENTIIRVSEARAMYSRNVLYNSTLIPDKNSRREMCRKCAQFFKSPESVSLYIHSIVNERI